MVKCLLSLLFVFLILSSFSFAKDDEATLQKEYGSELTKAPFFLRFAFYKEFDKDWKKSDYSERKSFLADYEKKSAADKKQEEADTKAESDKEKEDLREKKEADHQKMERLKAQIAEEKAEKHADADRQRKFDALVQDQERDLKQMQREAIQGINNR